MTPKFHTLTVEEVRRETEDTVSVKFTIPSNLAQDYAFSAGQYLTLKTTLNGEEIRRSYSLCSAPHEGEWRVAIKQVEQGKFSTFANTQLKSGDALDVMTPTGNFTLKAVPEAQKSYVLIAAGSGITPVLAIAKTILKAEPKSDVTLIYGNKGFQSIIFREELEAMKNDNMSRFRVVHVLSRESLGTPVLKGRITKQKTVDLYNAFLKGTTIDEVFICGPEAMILDAKAAMLELGVPEKNVHIELFTTPTSGQKTTERAEVLPHIASNVQIILDGDTIDLALDSDGMSILDAAQQAGADLPFACKGGVCCTCKARVIEGSASMDVNYALEPDEVKAGYILTCQSHPTSDKLVVSFDD